MEKILLVRLFQASLLNQLMIVIHGMVPGVLLRFRPRIGLDESLQDRILTKVRKRLSRQNSTKKCVNPKKIDKKVRKSPKNRNFNKSA